MDGGDGFDLFSQRDAYSPVHSFNPFAEDHVRRPFASAARHGLDLNSHTDEWPHLGDYTSFLHSTDGDACGSGGRLRPHSSPGGRVGTNRTLGVRPPRGGRPPTLRGAVASRGTRASVSAGVVGRGVRHREDVDSNDDDIDELPPMSKGHPEWKKLKYGPPEYLPILEEIFEGIAVDGSTAYVAGQQGTGAVDLNLHDDEDKDEPVQSPLSTGGSQKRASSSSTTATSPSKRMKSPVVKMMTEFLFLTSKQQQEHTTYLNEVAAKKREQDERRIAEMKLAQQVAKQDGVKEDSVEFFAVSLICKRADIRQFYLSMETREGRVAYLQRYARIKKLT